MNETDYREMVARYVRLAYERRITPGVGGNMSAKVGDRLYITPALANMRELTADGVVIADKDGKAVSAGRPAIETPMHTLIYREHPEVGAIVHVHAPYAVARSFLVDSLDLLTIEARYLLGPVPVLPETAPGTDALARQASGALKGIPEGVNGVDLLSDDVCQAVISKAHGVITIGASLRQAFDLAEILEDTAHVAYLRDSWG